MSTFRLSQDSHIHSTFSTDSTLTPESAARDALGKGLEGIVFVDHLDLDYPGHEAEFHIDFPDYIRTLRRLRDGGPEGLRIGIGLEAGYQPHVLKETRAILETYLEDFDFLINSVHIIRGEDPYSEDYTRRRNRRETYGPALEVILESLPAMMPYYDVIGHLEYVARHAVYPDRSLRLKDFRELLDEIFIFLARQGKGLELNTGTLRSGRRQKAGTSAADFAFDADIYRRYRELGGEILTVGSDAHHPGQIAYAFDRAADFLVSCGFRYYTVFEARKPKFIPIV